MNKTVPRTAPIGNMELIHDSSAVVSGPATIGDTLDSNIRKLDDVQPADKPYEIFVRFTRMCRMCDDHTI